MDKLSLNINELLRFVFAGGWAIALFLFINPETSKILLAKGLLEFGDLLFMSLIFGSIIYSAYRALLNPYFYKLAYTIANKYQNPRQEKISLIPFSTSKAEISDAITRWKKEKDKKSIMKRLTEWASQVHFLYCSAIAGIISIVLSKPLGDLHSNRLFYVSLSVAILFFSAFYSHIRYCMHYLTVKKNDD